MNITSIAINEEDVLITSLTCSQILTWCSTTKCLIVVCHAKRASWWGWSWSRCCRSSRWWRWARRAKSRNKRCVVWRARKYTTSSIGRRCEKAAATSIRVDGCHIATTRQTRISSRTHSRANGIAWHRKPYTCISCTTSSDKVIQAIVSGWRWGSNRSRSSRGWGR